MYNIYTTSEKFGYAFSFYNFSFILMTMYKDSHFTYSNNEPMKHIWNYVVNKKV